MMSWKLGLNILCHVIAAQTQELSQSITSLMEQDTDLTYAHDLGTYHEKSPFSTLLDVKSHGALLHLNCLKIEMVSSQT